MDARLTTEPSPEPISASRVALPSKGAKLFHSGAAALLLALMVAGFHHFYLQGRAYPGRELTPPIRTLLILHGVAMAGWMLLYTVQPLLIVGRHVRVHMLLGKLGAALAVIIVLLGLRLGIEATRISPPYMKIWSLSPRQFMAVPVVSILIFGGLVTAGIVHRKRREIHRAMMLLATLAAIPAAISRIDAISRLYQGTFWETLFGPFFGTLVIGAALVIAKYLLTRTWDRWLATGYAGLVLASLAIMLLARSALWETVSRALL